MPAKKDETGKRYGHLTVLHRLEAKPQAGKHIYWVCLCDCGNTANAQGSALRSGMTISCGCQKRVKHGHTIKRPGENRESPTYVTWSSMLTRCNNPRSTAYPHYGAKGITVCERWHSFKAFLEDMGVRPKGTSLDRIDSGKGYEPGNCRWATPIGQAQNTKRNDNITFQGETHCLAEWARMLGLSQQALYKQIHVRGWPIEKALGKIKQEKEGLCHSDKKTEEEIFIEEELTRST